MVVFPEHLVDFSRKIGVVRHDTRDQTQAYV